MFAIKKKCLGLFGGAQDAYVRVYARTFSITTPFLPREKKAWNRWNIPLFAQNICRHYFCVLCIMLNNKFTSLNQDLVYKNRSKHAAISLQSSPTKLTLMYEFCIHECYIVLNISAFLVLFALATSLNISIFNSLLYRTLFRVLVSKVM